MISRKKFHTIDELQRVQFLATHCDADVGLHSTDGSVIVDAKSYIGMFALDFRKPIDVVCDDENFHKQIHDIGENIPYEPED